MRYNLFNSFICTLALSLILAGSAYAYGGGTGEPNDPYQIWTPEQMNTIGTEPNDWNKCFRLMDDVNMAAYWGTQYNVIGNGDTPFTGTFDGNGHVITYLSYETTAPTSYIGLFGCIGSTAVIKDLGVESARIVARNATYIGILTGSSNSGTITGCYATGLIAGYSTVGGLVGASNSGTISDCHVAGTVVCDYAFVGGLAGFSNKTTIARCYSEGLVSGLTMNVGGLVGHFARGTITDSYSTCNVTGEPVIIVVPSLLNDANDPGDANVPSYVGGLVGYAWAFGTTLSNCYAGGSVTGGEYTGGLVGLNRATLNSCYSTGAVVGTGTNVGGLLGGNGGTVNSSFWDTDTSLQPTSDGGTGKTTTQMKDPNTFLAAGWDFLNEPNNGTNDYWRMCVSGVNYPHLTWEYVQNGDFACPDGVAIDDLSRLASDWLLTYSTPLYGADANGDKSVTFVDFAIMAEKWLQ